MTAALRRVVVVGASLAGLRAAEALRAEGFDGELTLVGAEEHPPYNRPPLSKELLAGDAQRDEVHLQGTAELAATWRLGCARPASTWTLARSRWTTARSWASTGS